MDLAEYDDVLTAKYGEALDWDIHSFYQIKPSEELYNHVFEEAKKADEPYLIVLMERSWTRYGGALGWADCEGSTATIYTFRFWPFYLDTHNCRHEMAHTILCRQGKEWVAAVHNDPEIR